MSLAVKPQGSSQWKQQSVTGIKLCGQVVMFCLLAMAGHYLALAAHIPIPGSVIGLGVLLFALLMNWVPESALKVGAAWLIGDLLLFFIPPVISVLKYEGMLEHYGLKLLLTLVLGTASVMVGTGFVVDRVFKLEQKLHLRRMQGVQA
ncbi:protein LrgA [Shewanella sp. NFH-SH190041]|nr:protein LrgA [Shewanella sp. NFH-SH190041]